MKSGADCANQCLGVLQLKRGNIFICVVAGLILCLGLESVLQIRFPVKRIILNVAFNQSFLTATSLDPFYLLLQMQTLELVAVVAVVSRHVLWGIFWGLVNFDEINIFEPDWSFLHYRC